MTKEEIAAEVLSALKAEEILERIETYLKKPGNTVSKKELLDIIQKGEEADEYYS